MFTMIADGLNYMSALDLASLIGLFWFTIIFDLPRYAFSFIAVALFPQRSSKVGNTDVGRISVVVAGHNEADAIERCVLSLREQSRPPDEIIVVSDGSTDKMPEKLRELEQRGLIDQAHCTHLRAGKAAAMNLAERWANGDIIINVDCDCSYHRHAIKRIIEPFENPKVGAVSGNILVRNETASLVAAFQAVEYLISISLSKQAQVMLDQVTCVSGAFGAFRSTALNSVNGADAGSGEDFDLTLRLRKAGWKIGFIPDSLCYTDVPATMTTLVKQRFRWERDAVRLRYRKHIDLINPFSHNFKITELLHEVEFFFFHVVAAAMLPFYFIWLFVAYGDLAPLILLAAQSGLLLLDFCSFLLAAIATPEAKCLKLMPFALAYGLFNSVMMRFVRLAAYVQEWLFNASAKDNYVPEKVQILRKW